MFACSLNAPLGGVGDKNHQQVLASQIDRAKNAAKQLVALRMNESGSPGLTVGVAVNGKPVWNQGTMFQIYLERTRFEEL
jgi:hypothetical protein